MSHYTEASAHGRFQPLHNGHMEYLLEAKRRCSFLWVGITAVEPQQFEKAAQTAREKPENNPLTYFERTSIISEALVETGLSRADFGFVPFPIEFPERLPNFMPKTVPCLTTICEEWNRKKITLLQNLGYEVVVLYERPRKEITGQQIREDIMRHGDWWRSHVPNATIRAAETLDVASRLRRLLSAT